jgi:glycosyltransferase involved in cell wall biosynthesis
MKLAIVCDDLIQNGGAEKLLEFVSKMFPEAPIYTSVATKAWLQKFKNRNVPVYTSFLQKFPFAVKLNRVYSVFLLHIFAFESFDFSKFDLVLSMSSRYAHFVITKPATVHVCYNNSPGRMFWEQQDYFEHEAVFGIGFLRQLVQIFLSVPLSVIRVLDYCAAQRVDYFISNSVVTQKRIKKYYGCKSVLINPFADVKVPTNFEESKKPSELFYLVITRLVAWKRVDIAIKACESLGARLKVVGTGPDMARLRNLADINTQILGHVSEEEKLQLLLNCTALINTQSEDFGIVPVEAMALGKPVIAYRSGGALETVIEGKTGEFFNEQTADCLAKTLKKFNAANFKKTDCITQAANFTKQKFAKNITEFLNSVYLKN